MSTENDLYEKSYFNQLYDKALSLNLKLVKNKEYYLLYENDIELFFSICLYTIEKKLENINSIF